MLARLVRLLLCVSLIGAVASSDAWASDAALTLTRALTRSLAVNPRLTAAERDIGIATGRRIQAGVIPNPEASFELDNAFGSGRFPGYHVRRKPRCNLDNWSNWAASATPVSPSVPRKWKQRHGNARRFVSKSFQRRRAHFTTFWGHSGEYRFSMSRSRRSIG